LQVAIGILVISHSYWKIPLTSSLTATFLNSSWREFGKITIGEMTFGKMKIVGEMTIGTLTFSDMSSGELTFWEMLIGKVDWLVG